MTGRTVELAVYASEKLRTHPNGYARAARIPTMTDVVGAVSAPRCPRCGQRTRHIARRTDRDALELAYECPWQPCGVGFWVIIGGRALEGLLATGRLLTFVRELAADAAREAWPARTVTREMRER